MNKTSNANNWILAFDQLDSLYRRSPLHPWYVGVEIDAFNPGSVLVDYILHLSDIADTLDTTDLKEILNQEMADTNSFFLGNYTLDPKGTDFIGKDDMVPAGSCLMGMWFDAINLIELTADGTVLS